MDKEIIIGQKSGDISAAVFEDGKLVEYYLERETEEQLTGNIYRGRVENVLPGMQAAFIDIGLEKNAYLYVDDVLANREGISRIGSLLKSGQDILVQVMKEPIGSKGPRVTEKLSLPGRYAVLLPNCDDVGISRKIVDDGQRMRLKTLADSLRERYQHGIILRTNAMDASNAQIEKDYQALLALWQDIDPSKMKVKTPALLHRDNTLLERVFRDLWHEDINTVVVNHEAIYQDIQRMLRTQSSGCRLRLADDEKIEMLYGITSEVDKALKRRVWLKNGGYLIIDQTEALTVIDVNTGKFVGTRDLQDTILQMNLEAAAEIARQIRLRNLGGIIIVDFIDMLDEENKAHLVEVLRQNLAQGRIKAQVLGVTQLGLVEITRKKSGISLAALLEKPCPYCEGKGRILSEATVAGRIKGQLIEAANRTEAPAIAVSCHFLVAAVLIGENRQHLQKLEQTLRKEIFIQGRSDYPIEKFTIQAIHQPKSEDAAQVPVLPQEIIRLQALDVHHQRPTDAIGRIGGFVIQIRDAADDVGQEIIVEIERVYATYAIAHKV